MRLCAFSVQIITLTSLLLFYIIVTTQCAVTASVFSIQYYLHNNREVKDRKHFVQQILNRKYFDRFTAGPRAAPSA